MKEINLTEKDVDNVLKSSILLGSVISKNKTKHFFYTPYDGKYSVCKDGTEIAHGFDLKFLLEIYNEV
jgi:hypothetical protein